MKQKMEGTQENVLVVDTKKKKDKKKKQPERGAEKALYHFCFPQIIIFRQLMMQ